MKTLPFCRGRYGENNLHFYIYIAQDFRNIRSFKKGSYFVRGNVVFLGMKHLFYFCIFVNGERLVAEIIRGVRSIGHTTNEISSSFSFLMSSSNLVQYSSYQKKSKRLQNSESWDSSSLEFFFSLVHLFL